MNSTTMTYDTSDQQVATARTGDDDANGREPRWLSHLDRRLDDFKARPDEIGPSGYPKPFAQSIESARRFAWEYFTDKTPAPNIVPTEDGGVEFVWYKGEWHLVAMFEPEETWLWAHNMVDSKMWYGSLEERSQELRALLEQLALEN